MRAQEESAHRVTRRFRFDDGDHRLDVGRCARIHVHNARVELVLAAESHGARGFVMDFVEPHGGALGWIHETLGRRLPLRDDDPVAEFAPTR